MRTVLIWDLSFLFIWPICIQIWLNEIWYNQLSLKHKYTESSGHESSIFSCHKAVFAFITYYVHWKCNLINWLSFFGSFMLLPGKRRHETQLHHQKYIQTYFLSLSGLENLQAITDYFINKPPNQAEIEALSNIGSWHSYFKVSISGFFTSAFEEKSPWLVFKPICVIVSVNYNTVNSVLKHPFLGDRPTYTSSFIGECLYYSRFWADHIFYRTHPMAVKLWFKVSIGYRENRISHGIII